MEKILIPYFLNHVSPRIEYAETFMVVLTQGREIIKKEFYKIVGDNLLEKIHTIKKINPDVIICNGISQTAFEKFKHDKIKIIPWQDGTIDRLLNDYLNQKIENKRT